MDFQVCQPQKTRVLCHLKMYSKPAAVCMHEVPLYLCSIFCSPSVVQLRTAIYRIWSAEHAPKMYPVTLRQLYTHSCCLIEL